MQKIVFVSIRTDNPHTLTKGMRGMSETKIIRVRIAIAISPNGEWAAAGYSGAIKDDDIKDMVFIDALPDGERFHWIEADVPVQQPLNIEGTFVEQPPASEDAL